MIDLAERVTQAIKTNSFKLIGEAIILKGLPVPDFKNMFSGHFVII